MIKLTAILMFFCIGFFTQAQVSDVKEKIDNSYEYYQDAFKKIVNAQHYISEAFNSSTISDIQWNAGNAESELTSAKRNAGYAEDEASDAEDEAENINCDMAEDSAGDAEDYFYDSTRKLDYAINELSSASYEDDVDYLSDNLNNAKSYINKALNDMSSAVDELNSTLQYLNRCSVPAETSSYNQGAQTPSCEDLVDYITSNGYINSTLSNYTLNSEWLSEVKAYTFDYNIYVIAKIKENQYSYSTKTYIFCQIPSANWSKFKNGGYGESKSYGERFHKYIIDYTCNCN